MPKLIILCLALLAAGPALASHSDDSGLLELSLSDLLQAKVTSVSRKSEELLKAPAAIYVITSEDIMNYGVTSVPEALRMAPGISANRIDNNKWAVSARGFSDRFANKLLVLVDGRSVYTPLFSGVFWDTQDIMPEDIERIEVIRGPGATLWGANAVNGVINIITKNSEDTKGLLVSSRRGTEDEQHLSLRYGGEFNNQVSYRVFGKHEQRGGGVHLATGTDAQDSWEMNRVGFRADWQSVRTRATLSGERYDGESGQETFAYQLAPPFAAPVSVMEPIDGWFFNASFEHTRRNGSQITIRSHFDDTHRKGPPVNEERETFDFEFNYRFNLFDSAEVVWGLGYRTSSDEFNNEGSNFIISSSSREFVSGFGQIEWELMPETLRLIAGVKLEDNEPTGFDAQPSARLMWSPDDRSALWLSASRAIRTPSRGDSDGTINQLFPAVPPMTPGNPLPLTLVSSLLPNPDIKTESLEAFEFGYRRQFSDTVFVDIASFYNRYEDLRSAAPGPLTCQPGGDVFQLNPACLFASGYVQIPITLQNETEGETFGSEATLEWRPNSDWRIQATYSYLDIHLDGDLIVSSDEAPEIKDPHHQASLRARYEHSSKLSASLWVRYRDVVPEYNLNARTVFDLRVEWRPVPEFEIALVGKNLNDPQEVEFQSELYDVPPIEVERSAYIQLRWTP